MLNMANIKMYINIIFCILYIYIYITENYGISTKILEDVTKDYDIYPYIQDTQWQGQFTHLYSYGSTYYTYFWCRKLAEEIWNKLFNSSTVDKGNYTFKKA